MFGRGTSGKRRLAGVKRLVDLVREFVDDDELSALINEEADALAWEGCDEIPETALAAAQKLIPVLERHGLYLSKQPDLESDLAYGPLADQLKEHFCVDNPAGVVMDMQKRKAENMHDFIKSNPDLCTLGEDPISAPLNYIVSLVKGSTN